MLVQQFRVAIQLHLAVIHALANQYVKLVLIVLVGHSHQVVLDSATMAAS
jgi:hypothetical protein